MADASGDPAEVSEPDGRYGVFGQGFFSRQDESPDGLFYDQPRFVTHIDDRAIAAVGSVYDELEIGGTVLDVCGSWISHFATQPEALVCQGMNVAELAANEQAAGGVVVDLNRQTTLPFSSSSFDAAVCCVSVDYLTQPIEVFDEVARVVRPGGRFVHVFSNRFFPTKAVRGWLASSEEGRLAIVSAYFRQAEGWDEPNAAIALAPGTGGDPLYVVWADRTQ